MKTTEDWGKCNVLEVAQQYLGDKFKFKKFIGSGGFAKIYFVKHKFFDTEHALKILDFNYIFETLQRRGCQNIKGDYNIIKERFFNEARFYKKIEHPNIIKVDDVDTIKYKENIEIPYMIMPFIKGVTLKETITNNASKSLSMELIFRISKDVLSALKFIHKHNIVHRDIKPSNIMIKNGEAILIDFGIAKDMLNEKTLTAEGVLPGSPAYIAPERIRGNKKIGPAADIYSFGIVLYEMFTAEIPFGGSNEEKKHAHLELPIPDVRGKNPDAPSGIQNIIETATKKNPDERYKDAQEFLDDLEKLERSIPPAFVQNEDKVFTYLLKELEDSYKFDGGSIEGGTFSNSYIIHHKILKEDCVLKIMDFNLTILVSQKSKDIKREFERQKERIIQEAKFFNTFFRHPNIADFVTIREFEYIHEREKYGVPYFIVKHIKGQSLTNLIKMNQLPFDIERILSISEDVLFTLFAIHQKGYIYWKLHPDKIIIAAKSSDTILIDAGLPKGEDFLNETELSGTASTNYDLLKTLVHLSPDSLGGNTKLDRITVDIFLFGLLLYEMVSGKIRCEKNFLENLGKRLVEPDIGLKTKNTYLPDGIVRIIKKTLSKDPGFMYRNVKEVLEDIKVIKKIASLKSKV